MYGREVGHGFASSDDPFELIALVVSAASTSAPSPNTTSSILQSFSLSVTTGSLRHGMNTGDSVSCAGVRRVA